MNLIDQKTFSPVQFPIELFEQRKVTRCVHPWDNTAVGGGFFVDGSTCKTAPSVPKRLTDIGYVFQYAKLDDDVLPGTVQKVTGYLFRRIQ